MTDQPEVMQWLTRFEQKFGKSNTLQALNKLENARELFYNELGYNITRKQFENLNAGKEERLARENVLIRNIDRVSSKGKEFTQKSYVDARTGQFMKLDKETGQFYNKARPLQPKENTSPETTRSRHRVDSKGNRI